METLATYLGSARKSLFRFEYLQDFSGTDTESFAAWQKTGNINHISLGSWWSFLERKHAEGVATTRVRLVTFPMSEYTKFELDVHRETANHGDDIRIISGDVFEKLKIPFGDFWMIDDELVIEMLYREHGSFKGIELKKGKEELYRRAKEDLIRNSVPIQKFFEE